MSLWFLIVVLAIILFVHYHGILPTLGKVVLIKLSIAVREGREPERWDAS